jgi:hypothetical protein
MASESNAEPGGRVVNPDEAKMRGRNALGVIPNTGTTMGVLAIAGAGHSADESSSVADATPPAPTARRRMNSITPMGFMGPAG